MRTGTIRQYKEIKMFLIMSVFIFAKKNSRRTRCKRLFDGAARIPRSVILIAKKAKAIDPSLSLLVWNLLSFGGHKQAIAEPILKKKNAGGDACSRTGFNFNVALAPEERAIPVRDINVGGG